MKLTKVKSYAVAAHDERLLQVAKITASLGGGGLFFGFAFHYDAKKRMLLPSALALVNPKQFSLPGLARLSLV